MSRGKARQSPATRVPPEVLLVILANASTTTLRSTSLVHPVWRDPSQYLLHTELSLPSRQVAKKFLNVDRTSKTFAKKLSLPISLDTEDCCQVLEQVRGLDYLTLVATEGATGKSKFEVDLLESTALAGLRSLRLTAPFSEPIHPSASFTFPFKLSAISFKGPFDSFPIPLLEALVASSSSSVISLDLDVYGSQAAASRFFDALGPVAPRIKSMVIHGSDRSSTSLAIFLTACTSLRSFTCWEATPSLLSSLSPTIESLTIEKTFVFHNDVVYDTLLSQSGVLEYVKLVRWSGISRASLKAQRGGFELLADLEEKGIETQFGAESHGHWYGLGLRH